MLLPCAKILRHFPVLIYWILVPVILFAQTRKELSSIFFYQLNTAHGLSDNYIFDMCMDKSGNLWIATGDGLNMYNGKSVSKFLSHEYPQLRTDELRKVLCDEYNRIWVLNATGNVTVIDENRKFHRVGLYEEGKFQNTRTLLQTKDLGVILLTWKRFYHLPGIKSLAKLDSLSTADLSSFTIKGFDTLHAKGYPSIEPAGGENYVFGNATGFFKINFRTKSLDKEYKIPNLRLLALWKPTEYLAWEINRRKLLTVDLVTEKIGYPFENVKDQFGNRIVNEVWSAKLISENQLLITANKQGLFLFNKTSNKLYNYSHNPADPNTLANNYPRVITPNSDGWIFIGARANAISYFKSDAVIGQQTVFIDKKGNGYDGFINGVKSKDNDNYYICGSNKLFSWKRSTNETKFIYLEDLAEPSVADADVGYLTLDNEKRLWVSTSGKGIFVLDKNDKVLRHLRHDSSDTKSLPSNVIGHMEMGPGGYMWVNTRVGVCRINAKDFSIDKFDQGPLKPLNKLVSQRIWFDDNDDLWLGTPDKGVWHYNFTEKVLKVYTKKEGLPSDNVQCVNKDRLGNIYVGTVEGLSIFLNNGKIKNITVADGLMNRRIEALLLDKNNRMWMGNDVGIAGFNIADTTVKAFDERYGLSVQGFRIGSYCQNQDDELVWGTEKGLQYFYPDDLWNQKVSVPTFISRVETRSVASNVTGNEIFNLPSRDNYVSFYFTSIDYSRPLKTFYEYRLEGIDEKWIRATNQDFVRYSSLPAGKFTFKVRASNDGKIWKNSENEITINIATPFYETWWFRVIALLLGLLIIWYVLKYYQNKQRKQREELEAQVVINYFASQINRHLRTEDILRDVAKNCISKLNFEDCVIYLIDEERNVLVQKAAWGPKLSKDLTIYQPIEIPVGEGIVGSVAQTGKPELIPNTELDKRYIADDARRLSELAVPLIINNKVIGVIDSEHTRKNFFTKRHLNILSTVAVLCATQIERAKAEQEEQEAQLVINYFASQIHSRLKTDDLLWDVAKNLIGKMGFEDCMIYLWNNDKTMLVQKAGYGSKGSMQAIMDKTAYHIPKGKGIVGAAVESGKSLLVNDTSKDERYFTADEKIMLSELCVPLIHGNEVLGAINTEHHQKNFFTSKHQKMLSTIAALCANQLQRIRAEEEKQQARIEALQNKQKAAETRLQSLRLQMNPHFLFNALNSIQQMILANEDMVATKYLSRFSKLLRTILVHSDKEFVTLKEELEILNLYIELESIRFKDSFNYVIECDDSIDAEEIKLPTLLIQPFAENAIWHGLMHKEGNRLLQIKFREVGDCLHCTIEDNGIGRERSREAKLATGQGKKHTSKGIQVSKERLEAMSNGGSCKGSLQIFDLKDKNGQAAGTRVHIVFPTLNN